MNKKQVICSIGEPEYVLHGQQELEFLMYPKKGIFVRVRGGRVHSYGSIKDNDFAGLTQHVLKDISSTSNAGAPGIQT